MQLSRTATAAKVGMVVMLMVSIVTFSPPTDVSEAGHRKTTFRCWGQEATIRGSRNGETIIGTEFKDVIRAGKGGDRVFAGAGKDYVCGMKGDDTLHGGDGFDRINGGPGNDVCFGDRFRNCETEHRR